MDILNQVMRIPFLIGLWFRFPIGPVATRVYWGIFRYPHYAFGVYWAAVQASRLGIPRISVLEFGVAGGRGLLALEAASREIALATGVRIDVFGFDSGAGMPKPKDHLDLPHIWGEGFYRMDEQKLRARLATAELLLGDVKQTVKAWLADESHAPVGFAAFDLDYYSSTRDALEIFRTAAHRHLPRVYCYFDDVVANELGCMNPYVGELLAIQRFNEMSPERKIARIEQLRLCRPRWELWQDRMFAFHDFAHPHYCDLLIPAASKETQLALA